MAFKPKCVLIIGATSGIGEAIAKRLLGEGCQVIAVGRREDRLHGLVHEYGRERITAIKFDVTDRLGVDAFVHQ